MSEIVDAVGSDLRYWGSFAAAGMNRMIKASCTTSLAIAMVRIGKGARVELEQAEVNGELWFPQWLRVTASARAMLFIGANVNISKRFHDFRKYQVESSFTLTGEAP